MPVGRIQVLSKYDPTNQTNSIVQGCASCKRWHSFQTWPSGPRLSRFVGQWSLYSSLVGLILCQSDEPSFMGRITQPNHNVRDPWRSINMPSIGTQWHYS